MAFPATATGAGGLGIDRRTGRAAARRVADLYRFYRAGSSMLTNIYRDLATLPEQRREFILRRDAQWCDLLAKPFRGTATVRRRKRALIGHAVSFWTWRSLYVDQGLSESEAVDAMVTLLESAEMMGR